MLCTPYNAPDGAPAVIDADTISMAGRMGGGGYFLGGATYSANGYVEAPRACSEETPVLRDLEG